MKNADPVRVIEAAYDWVPDEAAWLDGIVRAAAPYDMGPGVVACTVGLNARPVVTTIRGQGEAPSTFTPIRSLVSRLTPSFARELFAPTEFVGNARWRMERMSARSRATTTSMARTEAPSETAGKAPEESIESLVPPLWAVVAGDGKSRAAMLGFLGTRRGFTPEKPFPHRDRHLFGLVGAHLGTALRLRQAARPATDDDLTEAVLDVEGRILHAKGTAQDSRAKQSLSEAVVRTERARGKLRRVDAEEATRLWEALVAERWSIVELVESDGKRLLLARATPLSAPERPDAATLTKSESDVVWLAAFGHSYKFIAYELGINASSVVRHLDGAMLKLGVSSRRELLRKLAR